MTEPEIADVVVIGGGPGGATIAALLARRGRRVIVFERDRFPRFHIGESLLPASAPIFAALGLTDELDRRFQRKYGARFRDDRGGVDAPASTASYDFSGAFPPAIPCAWQVERAELDELLLRRAAALGADVREGFRVEDVVREGGAVVGVVVVSPSGERRVVRASVVVDASGRDARLTPATKRTRIAGLDKTAIFTHVKGGLRGPGLTAGHIDIVILADDEAPSWAWFIPFADGRSSVGFVLSSEAIRSRIHDASAIAEGASDRLQTLFEDEVRRSPWMTRLIDGAPYAAPVRAAADYSFRVGEIAGDGWLAVGDAAGFLDPLFSTGAHLALGGAARAAVAIDDALTAGDFGAARFAGYATAVRSAADLFLGAVQAFYRGELPRLLFAENQRATLRRMITTMLAGDVFHDDHAAPWVGYFRERFPAA